jgi:hypothetical protein
MSKIMLYSYFLKKYQILIFFLILFMNINYCNALEGNFYFVGHAYGVHGNVHIPDKSLKNFLIKESANFF